MANVTLDNMEYSSNAAAQAAYVTNDASPVLTSTYPPAHSDTYVKSTSEYGTAFKPYFATDPTLSLTGTNTDNQWVAASGTNQRFHIDLGSAKIIKGIYYENGHTSGSDTNDGAKNFTFWGSNSATAFTELTYGTDTDWTQITPAQSTFDVHIGSDVADPKYITVTNTTAYRYYAFKFADTISAPTYGIQVRRIELQENIYALQSYSESTTKTQGSYSLKGVATTDAVNKTLTRTVSSTLDLTDIDTLTFDIRSSRTGSNIKIGIHDSGGTTTETTPNITSADTFQTVSWDISAVSNANKDVIDSIIITQTNADAETTWYIDNFNIDFPALVETITVSSTTNKSANRLFLETLTLTDIYLRVWSMALTFTETCSLTDSYSRTWALTNRSYSETITLVDTVNKATAIRAISDSITIGDILQEWLNKDSGATTWTVVSSGSSPWVLVATSTSMWV